MKLAVISDIHGNLEALREVLVDIDRCQLDAVVCLGDTIGYGPESEQTLALIRQRNIPSVLGNHELAVKDPKQLSWFNPRARKSLKFTAKQLSADSVHYITGLKPFLVDYGCRFVHGFPPDSVTKYLFQFSEKEIPGILSQLKEQRCFIGHTHTLEIIGFDGHAVTHSHLSKTSVRLKKHHQYIINIGSVGQPRDGDNHAKYVIWDSSSDRIETRFVPYDISSVVQKMQALGLPREHATRLL